MINRKSILSGLFVSMMVLSLIPAVNARAAVTEIWVNGKNIVTTTSNTVPCGSGTAVYDVHTNTLTLNDAEITQANMGGYGIENKTDNDFTIVLLGNNRIDISETTGVFAFTESNMKFTGGGSLEIKAKQSISNHKNIVFDHVNITAVTNDAGSINADGNIIIKNHSSISSSGLHFAFNTGGSMLISESDVTATASAEGMNALFISGAITIEKNATVNATSYYPALFSYGDINISDSTIEATSTADYGIWSRKTLAITGNSDVTSTGAIGSIGASTSATVTPVTGKMVEIKTGVDKNSAESVENSPFAEETDISIYANQKYFNCKIHTHTPATTWSNDEAGHWHECTANDGYKMDAASHTFGEWEMDAEATQTAQGSKHRDCTVCGYRETADIPMLEHTHTPANTWSSNKANHWHECTANDGYKMDVASHTFGEWEMDAEATQTVEGSRHRDCTVCGYRETAAIPATGETPVKPSSPQTGDTSNTLLCLGLITGCIVFFGLKKGFWYPKSVGKISD